MSAEMDLLHAIERKRVQIWQGLRAMVVCRHEDVVDVEQQPASGSLRYLGQEVDLRDRAFGKTNVSGWIFEQHLASKRRLCLVDMLGDPRQRLRCIGERQKVVEVHAAVRRPGEMFGETLRRVAIAERF